MKARLVEPHDCPHQVKFLPPMTPSATSSGSASGKAISAFFPPSSSITALSVSDAAFITARPVGTEPISAIIATSLCEASAEPASLPPGTILNTPGGNMPSVSSARRSGGQRRLFRRLHHYRIAGGEGRARFSGAEHERMVERNDAADDTARLARPAIEP